MTGQPAKPALPVLKKRSEFLAAAKGGRVVRRAFVLQARARDDTPGISNLETARIGYTVTKKVGNAVERNRIKRRLRAAAREVACCAQPGLDYVVIGRRAALQADFASIAEDLAAALKASRTRPSNDWSNGRKAAATTATRRAIH